MSEYRAGGRRRIDRVLAPGFLEALADISSEDLRTRQQEAQLEEADLSYARRLLQGRLDLLRDEQSRRGTGRGSQSTPGRSDEEIVAALTRILADSGVRPAAAGGPSTSRRRPEVQPPEVSARRRAPELAATDVTSSDLKALDAERLASTIERLEDLERRVSASRAAVHRALDAVAGELDRRRYGEAGIPLDGASGRS